MPAVGDYVLERTYAARVARFFLVALHAAHGQTRLTRRHVRSYSTSNALGGVSLDVEFQLLGQFALVVVALKESAQTFGQVRENAHVVLRAGRKLRMPSMAEAARAQPAVSVCRRWSPALVMM
jgi:hypothetical protein